MNPLVVVALITLGGSLIASLLVFVATRGKTQADRKSAMDARIDARLETELTRVYKRIDEQETELAMFKKTFGAATRIIRDLAKQWPASAGIPNLNPADIAELETTIPVAWIRNHTKENP